MMLMTVTLTLGQALLSQRFVCLDSFNPHISEIGTDRSPFYW